MIKKISGIAVLVVVVGLLVFGAIQSTAAKFEEEAETSEIRGGNGGYGSEGEITSSGEGLSEEHVVVTTPLALIPIGELNPAETDALLYMWEEEKLARDVYTAFAAAWTKPLFANIAASEQYHMDSVKELLDRYGLAAPTNDVAGVFANADLQTLYTHLVAQGNLSELDAVKAGAAIEEIDILDLQKRLAQTDQADIQQVFNALLSGTYNHLNSFVANYWNSSGSVYVPQYMSQVEYDAIVTSTTFGTQGGGRGNGRK